MERCLCENSRSKVWMRALAVCCLAGASAMALAGCSSETPKPAGTEAEKKPAATATPAIPDEYQDAAKAMLGSDATVLLFGDLAKTGKEQVLAANVVPNTPKSVVAGTVVTRAVIAEKTDGKWTEIFRADEHLKNTTGYLGLTPFAAVTGWKLQYEQSPEKGLTVYFTPITAGSNQRTLPIAVSWNPQVKRYQSMDQSYQKFLKEVPSLDNPRSTVR
jgi:hypothetical protein